MDAIEQDQVPARLTRLVLAQSLAVAMLDGFDTQLIAFIAPVLTKEWSLTGIEMGQLLAAGLVGLLVGTIFLGPLSDRVGRRPILLVAVALFAVCTIASAMSKSMYELLFWRFITGIGLGAAVVCCFALAAEFASKTSFGLSVSVVKAGFPFGAALGAIVSAYLISAGGWRVVLWVAGILPLLLLPILYSKLPESPGFLRGVSKDAGLFRRLLPKRPTKGEAHAGMQSLLLDSLLARLFLEGRAPGTVLLWGICFLNLLTIYVLVMWLPSLLEIKGFSRTVALNASALFTMSGVAGGFLFGWIIPRQGPAKVLGGACIAGVAAVWALAASNSTAFALLSAGMAGAAILGTQFGTVVLLAGFYPIAVRSTGIGWALGVGRIGAIVAPMLTGLILDMGYSANQILQSLTLPLVMSAVLLILLARTFSRRVT